MGQGKTPYTIFIYLIQGSLNHIINPEYLLTFKLKQYLSEQKDILLVFFFDIFNDLPSDPHFVFFTTYLYSLVFKDMPMMNPVQTVTRKTLTFLINAKATL